MNRILSGRSFSTIVTDGRLMGADSIGADGRLMGAYPSSIGFSTTDDGRLMGAYPSYIRFSTTICTKFVNTFLHGFFFPVGA